MTGTLSWYGHACFGLDLGEGGILVFDPYEAGSVPGVELPEGLRADRVLCSHGHGDHNAAHRVTLTGAVPAAQITLLDSFHDPEGGALRGTNAIALVEYGGFRMAHLGDLGCALTREQADALQGLDLLLLPVGGHFTIGPAEAAALLEQLQPRIAVPMHYRLGSMGYPIIAELDEFLRLLPAYTPVSGSTLTLTPALRGVYVPEL